MKILFSPSILSSQHLLFRFLFLLLTFSSLVNSFAPTRVPTTTGMQNGIPKNLQNAPRPSYYDNFSKSILTTRSSTGRCAADKLVEPIYLDTTEDKEASDTSSSSSIPVVPSRRHLARGLLLSSFSDGLVPNPQAIEFFMDSLVETMRNQYVDLLEQKVASSALASPCCGPTDIDSFNQLLDATDETDTMNSPATRTKKRSWKAKFEKLLEQQQQQQQQDAQLELRFLYIPTAMYALRKDSTNSPGKQRQRARADGKKRRTQIMRLIQDQFAQAYREISGADEIVESPVNVLTITLDFDDDSLKQPEGSTDASKFPSSGMEALQDWKPNLIYVQGGNTFWLYHCMEKGNYKDALIDAVTLGDDNQSPALYCGTSAGAILAGSLMETATWKGWDDPTVDPDRPNYEDWNEISGLDLIGENVSFFPHMSQNWQDMVDGKMEKLNAKSSSDSPILPSPNVYCLTDDQALCIDGSGLDLSRTLLK